MFPWMHDQPDPVIAALLKQIREERQITQEDLAFRSGITVSALSRIERGRNNPRLSTVIRIAQALEISFLELATRAEAAARDAR
jgi:transcriptional regulator with XRE-family HTH domain